jgi:hypothetical protein
LKVIRTVIRKKVIVTNSLQDRLFRSVGETEGERRRKGEKYIEGGER